MLDIKLIRQNPEAVKAAVNRRNGDYSAAIDELLKIDEQRRVISSKADKFKAEQNAASKEIPLIKKEGGDLSEIMARMKTLSDDVKECDKEISELTEKQRNILLSIPNMPNPTIPDGEDDKENRELRRWGEPRKFDFEAKAHWDLGKDLGILDPETAAKVSGARFHFYRGLGARLERAVFCFFMDTHADNGYEEIIPPYRDDILDGSKLPLKYCAFSACFRAEAGSAGRDTRGLIRQHQFHKVELVKFVKPEHSYDELETLTNDAEKLLQMLGLPYRVVCLSAGDLGFSSAMTYDIEVWLPSYNRYCEISSCSNFEDYQARRAAIRYKDGAGDKAKFVHTLNGSGLAVGRTVAAILENYQNADGTVTVPEVLRKYMNTDIIG